jgi:predicted unusual protein kinase regulating ubiquinone biosynthesis (AarF/ABC1/UbiB family)
MRIDERSDIGEFRIAYLRVHFLAARKQFDINLLDTFAAASFLELDYQHEAANQQRFIRELSQVYIN